MKARDTIRELNPVRIATELFIMAVRTEMNMGPGNGDGRRKDGELSLFIEQWKKAPAYIESYQAGIVKLAKGLSYHHREGKRLTILGNPVMDTCEYPWASETVNLAFNAMVHPNSSRPVRVLEMGFGLGITANRVIEQLSGQRLIGEYKVVELNHQVYLSALEWKRRKEAEFHDKDREQPGSKPDIKIEVVEGEAGQEARRMLREIGSDENQKFDIVISDTFPLKPADQGINDIKDSAVIVKLITAGGVFAFYPFVPGTVTQAEIQDGLTSKQRALVKPYFDHIVSGSATVNPPREYPYLFRRSGPIRSLPVAVAVHPKTT